MLLQKCKAEHELDPVSVLFHPNPRAGRKAHTREATHQARLRIFAGQRFRESGVIDSFSMASAARACLLLFLYLPVYGQASSRAAHGSSQTPDAESHSGSMPTSQAASLRSPAAMNHL